MSSGLMSCVRENSPPLELDLNATSGPLSSYTSEANMMAGATTSTPLAVPVGNAAKSEPNATPNAEQQKRRRFHPLRNLRRIFRRRTITSAADTATASVDNTAGSSNTLPPSVSSSSEKNLRSATLSAISSVGTASASSPSSPLTHQQLQESYQTQSLPKSKSYGTHRDELLSAILGKKKRAKQDKQTSANTTPTHTHIHETNHQYHHNQNLESVEHDMYSATTTATSASTSYHQRFHQHQQQQLQSQSQQLPPLPLQRQSMGIAVFPSAMNRSFFAERQKLRSVGDSSQDLDSSGNESGHGHNNTTGGGHMNISPSNGGEMSDSQRSLSEGRLIDSDYTRDALSQSHDSVFSESATASSLSIVLKAELADVLRKRRNRPDASDEDLGLPRSPTSPQRRAGLAGSVGGMRSAGGALPTMSMSTPPNVTCNSNTTGDVSSLSLLSMNSTDGEDISGGGVANDSDRRYNLRISTNSSVSMASDILRPYQHEQQPADEVDRVSSERQRLSHSAAKHKMAIRPIKKNVPTRQHRRTLEVSIPEANEESLRAIGQQQATKSFENDIKTKTRSMPPFVARIENTATATTTTKATTTAAETCVNASTTTSSKQTSIRHEAASSTTTTTTAAAATKTTTTTTNITNKSESSTITHSFGLRALTSKASALFDNNRESSTDDVLEPDSNESGFLRRFMHRNSKRSIAKISGNGDDAELSQSEPKKLQISTSCMEAVDREPLLLPNKSRSAASYEQNISDTRRIIKREINNEGKTGLNAMVNNFSLTSSSVREQVTTSSSSTVAKPKSGPAARQRYLPQELSSPVGTLQKPSNSNSSLEEDEDVISVTNLLSKSSRGSDTFQSTTILREITAAQQMTTSSATPVSKPEPHFEKKAKIVGLSSFQQKLTRSNESFGRNSNSSNSLETSTDEPSLVYYTEKQRKTVEKSRSFRNYQDERDALGGGGNNAVSVHNNMPSLPDLSLSFRVPVSYYNDFVLHKDNSATPSNSDTPTSPTEKCVSLGFEINDNKLLKSSMPSTTRAESASHLRPDKNAASKKNTPAKIGGLMPTISPRNSTNITEIEQNIDFIMKSPFVSVLRKPAHFGEEPESPTSPSPPSGRPRSKSPTKQPENKLPASKTLKERPKVLELKQTTEEARYAMTPTTAAVPLREKTVAKPSAPVSNSLNASVSVEKERRSAPAGDPIQSSATQKAHSFKSTRRSSSVVDGGISDASDNGTGHVPEFMKIQLNRVDHARLNKTNNVVLAKNVKPERLSDSTSVAGAERSYSSTDDLSLRRASNDSIEIVEHENDMKMNANKTRQPRSVQRQNNLTTSYSETSSKQTRAVSANSVRPSSVYSTGSSSNGGGGSVELLTSSPRSPVKQSPTTTAAPTTPTSPTVKSPKKQPTTASPTKAEPAAATLVTVRTTEASGSAFKQQQQSNNKTMLEERRRLFLNEEQTKAKVDRKIEDLRMERKKSLSDELYRRTSLVGGEAKDAPVLPPIAISNNNNNNNNNAIAITPTTPTDSVVESSNLVILRKKSFASTTQQVNGLNGSATVTSINGGGNNNNNNNNNNITSNIGSDGTPELMKVFARRSLKVKDDDLLVNVIPSVAPTNSLKKSTPNTGSQGQTQHQSVDSDKENQSASEEKLDKLNKYESNVESNNVGVGSVSNANVGSNKLTHSGNRNSLADFRNVNNSNNNNVSVGSNGSNTTTTGSSAGVVSAKSYLPPIKVSNLRHSGNTSISNNNNSNSNNNNTSVNSSQINSKNNNINQNSVVNMKVLNNERYSVPVPVKKESPAPTITTLPTAGNMNISTKSAIERSATVSEFKGIHQRRAEWEQRAKEALK